MLGNIVTQVLGIDFLKNQWLKAIDAFSANEVKFRVAYADILKNRKKYYDAGLRTQYDSVFNKGRIIQNSVETVINATKKIYDYFNTQTNLGSPFIAAIPIGTILGLTALIGSFLLYYHKMNQDFIQKQVSSLPPDQQAEAIKAILKDTSEPAGKGFAEGLTQPIYIIGGIIILALFLPKLLNRK